MSGKSKNLQKYLKYLIGILVLAFCTVLLNEHLSALGQNYSMQHKSVSDETFRKDFFSEKMWQTAETWPKDCQNVLNAVQKDVVYYPVPLSTLDASLTTSYADTWMEARSYKATYGHEGTDILASQNKRGLYPVVSMTDGVVTNLGWLKKGGYRIGITSDHGIYYYYAHLDSYASLSEGSRVKAGTLLGYMGDSGYGKEGTKGEFPVHLHLGIYIYEGNEEISLNPYYVLQSLENNKLKYAYF